MQHTSPIIPLSVNGPVPDAPCGHSWHSLMGMALEEAAKGEKHGEIPVGAVLVSVTGKILARAHNASLSQHDPSAHAEIMVLRQGGAALANYRLNDCILVVTLEPCLMCTGALVHSRVAGLVYGAADRRAGAVHSCCEGLDYSFLNHKVWHMGGVRGEECAALLHAFFDKKVCPQRWYVYIVRCADDTLYCGITTDIQRRIDEHNGHKAGGAKYTRIRRPVQLCACAPCVDRSAAAKLEAFIQSSPRQKKIARLVSFAQDTSIKQPF